MLSQRELDEFLGGFNQRRPAIKKVQFPELHARDDLPRASLAMDFLGDVTVDICAELGQVTLTVRDILNIQPESVIELEKAAGDNVDLKVNDQLFARGEVIIIGNNLGIRVDRILDPGQSKTPGKDGVTGG